MKRKPMYLLIFMVNFMFACDISSNVGNRADAVYENTTITQEGGTFVKSVPAEVIADQLNVRNGAGEDNPAEWQGLRKGQTVTLFLSCTGGELREWVALDADCTRWVASRYVAVGSLEAK